MKTRKQCIAVALVAIIALAIIGCKGDEPTTTEQPKDQSEKITLSFGSPNSHTATVKGTLTDTEWSGVADKIKTAIEERYEYYKNMNGTVATDIFQTVFERNVTIIVEKTPSGYTKWKTTTDGKTMYLAFSQLDNELNTTVTIAIGKMKDNTADSDMAQVQPDTPRTLTFGTEEGPFTVTIKSADQFTAAEWKTLCDKIVAAIERGFGAAPSVGIKASIENYFKNNTISVVLLKSATLDCEVKSDEQEAMSKGRKS